MSEETTASLLSEASAALNQRALAQLAEYGHHTVRLAHAAVLTQLGEEGTTVTALAERARITKQSMAELVRHLEDNGYVERVTDPADRRAKVVTPTHWGRDVAALVTSAAAETEDALVARFGARRLAKLREELSQIIAGP